MTGQRYLDSLIDRREVWIDGERAAPTSRLAVRRQSTLRGLPASTGQPPHAG